MTKVNSVKINDKPLLTPKNTGYAATTGLLLTTASSFSKNRNIRRFHKTLGIITGGLTLLHLGLVEYLHHKYKKM